MYWHGHVGRYGCGCLATECCANGDWNETTICGTGTGKETISDQPLIPPNKIIMVAD